jgi:hypothetical protein
MLQVESVRRKLRLWSFLLATAVTISGGNFFAAPGAKNWVEHWAEIEEFLRSAEVVATEKVGWGITQPRKLSLEKQDRSLAALWKSLARGRRGGIWESHQAEAAAYELDKLLGLDMVPPTVLRRLGDQDGSLQLWVEGSRLFAEVQSQKPPTKKWERERSCMLVFDNLICNPDRNARNYMVASDWSIILIDHSQAFMTRSPFYRDRTLCLATGVDSVALPERFDRKLVARLRQLEIGPIQSRLGELLSANQMASILERRDALLQYIDELVAENGESAVYF